MVCKNLKELKNVLQDKVNYALLTDVSDTITEVMVDHIIEDVYNAYTPETYNRRFNDGGLMDSNNINRSVEANTLVVENNTVGSPYYYYNGHKYISQNKNKEIVNVIETGIGYDIDGWEYDTVPRPFIHNTREDLINHKYHIAALKQGLKKQGLEVK